MKTSQAGIDLIKHFEGFRKEAYLCPGGVWTIGYGHTRGVRGGDVITERQAEDFLRKDLEEAEFIVEDLISEPLLQNQFDALVSLVYNIGSGNFHDSTIRRLINAKCTEVRKLEHAWKMWKKSQGVTLSGLIRRREAEFNLYKKDL